MASGEAEPGKNDIVAQRSFELKTDDGNAEVLLRIGRPVPDRDASNWSCTFEIVGLGRSYRRDAFGVDALQALELTMKMAGAILYTSEEWTSARLTWNKGRNLFVPIPDAVKDLVPEDC